jgi:hypothetical protein
MVVVLARSHMASPAHINRSNAQNSTGPTSFAGKAVTRFNALSHGMDAASLVIPGEDPDELSDLAAELHGEYDPQGAVEAELVETLVRSTWFQHRYARIEAQLFATILRKMDDPGATVADAFYHDAAGPNVLGKLFRRQRAAQRDFDKALAELRRIQKLRIELEALQPAPPPPSKSVPPPAAGPHPKPIPGQRWVGSEPPSWRL